MTENITSINQPKEFGKLAVELRKIEKKLHKCSDKLSEDENKSFDFLFLRICQLLEKNQVKVTDFTGEKWNEGMALLDIIAVEEKDGIDEDRIGEMINPLIEVNGEIIQRGKVVIYVPKKVDPVEDLIEIPSDGNCDNEYKGMLEQILKLKRKILIIILGIVFVLGIMFLIFPKDNLIDYSEQICKSQEEDIIQNRDENLGEDFEIKVGDAFENVSVREKLKILSDEKKKILTFFMMFYSLII